MYQRRINWVGKKHEAVSKEFSLFFFQSSEEHQIVKTLISIALVDCQEFSNFRHDNT